VVRHAGRSLFTSSTQGHLKMSTTRWVRRATARDMQFFQNPQLWTCHPFLPLSRQAHGSNDASSASFMTHVAYRPLTATPALSSWPTCSSCRLPSSKSSPCPRSFSTRSTRWPTTAGASTEAAPTRQPAYLGRIGACLEWRRRSRALLDRFAMRCWQLARRSSTGARRNSGMAGGDGG